MNGGSIHKARLMMFDEQIDVIIKFNTTNQFTFNQFWHASLCV